MKNKREDSASVGVKEQELIGRDIWKQLRRILIPLLDGNKSAYESWKAEFSFDLVAFNFPITKQEFITCIKSPSHIVTSLKSVGLQHSFCSKPLKTLTQNQGNDIPQIQKLMRHCMERNIFVKTLNVNIIFS